MVIDPLPMVNIYEGQTVDWCDRYIRFVLLVGHLDKPPKLVSNVAVCVAITPYFILEQNGASTNDTFHIAWLANDPQVAKWVLMTIHLTSMAWVVVFFQSFNVMFPPSCVMRVGSIFFSLLLDDVAFIFWCSCHIQNNIGLCSGFVSWIGKVVMLSN